jgi:hypothetical protein
MWSFAIHDFISGRPICALELDANRMGRRMNDTDKGSSAFTVPRRMSRAALRDITQPRSRVLVKRWKGDVRYAHVLTGRSWDGESRSMSLRHEDIRGAITTRRTLFGTNGYSGTLEKDNGLVIENRSLNIVPALIYWAGTEGPTGNFDTPMYLPQGKLTNALVHQLEASMPGTFSKTWYDSDGIMVDDAMREVQDLGPDVFYEAREDGNGWLQWLMRIGDLSGSVRDFNMTAAKVKCSIPGWEEDDSNTANITYAFGNGADRGKLVRSAQSEPTTPATERIISYSNEENVDNLQAHANTDNNLWRQPTEQWSLSVDASRVPRVGGKVKLFHRGDVFFPDGWTSIESLGDTSDLSDDVELELQPTGGGA